MIKNSSTLFLRIVVLILASIVLGLCLVALPIGIMSDTTGLYRWILLSLYIPALPFFYAIYQTMQLLGYIDNNLAFSEASVNALRSIKHCGAIIAGLFTLLMPYVYYVAESDDAPGIILIGLILIAASTVVAVFAAVLQRILKNALEIKQENDMTI
jgi:hypothetical protein